MNENNNLSINTFDNINSFDISKKNNILIKIIFSFAFTILMAISANVFLYIPSTPIPITLQTLTVLLSGIFLGSKFAALSQLQYLILGIIGFPVFAGFKSSITAILGPTGGFLIGFIFAAFVTGYIYEKLNISLKNKIFLCFISCLVGLIIIYFFGFIHLFFILYFLGNHNDAKLVLFNTFNYAIKPFILIDFIKLFIVIDLTSILNIKKNK